MIYEILDHTADFGVHIFAQDERELFQNAARALVDIALEDTQPSYFKEKTIKKALSLQGMDWPDLMINWLRELHYLIFGEGLKFYEVRIGELEAFRLKADLHCIPLDPRHPQIKNEIKAVTYHQAEVLQTPAHWQAKIIFDV